ncbi:hypothetical protein BDN72DRAFT_950267 [Pluteus cervinus]|uniref:Uncharacterized protein n=1 Tax=Pluteus cervinus TaxID=181527 RepID=A0ACD3ATQ4_9AGAR|nr:hypothetical protein BDN72DRAFT_950267 [Pluteus cervinus]
MFKFDFDIDDLDEEQVDFEIPQITDESTSTKATSQQPFIEISLEDLLISLPSQISYSNLSIPLSSKGEFQSTEEKSITLSRRDLFDARFQLIAEDEQDESAGSTSKLEGKNSRPDASALQFIEAPSDLVPGVHEGGLKTWECSLDLVDYLDGLGKSGLAQGKRTLEVGCGTAVPSMYLLHTLLQGSPPSTETHIHLQDYNVSVLQLVTLPNILLTWCRSAHIRANLVLCFLLDNSHAAFEFRSTEPKSEDDAEALEIEITPDLTSAFVSSLKDYKVHLRFFAGSWATFNLQSCGGAYDIVLSSETIYQTSSLPSLVALLKAACGHGEALEDLVQGKLTISSENECLCLIAAKVVYFGVGGGVPEFIKLVEHNRGAVTTVLERRAGVGRKILGVDWL